MNHKQTNSMPATIEEAMQQQAQMLINAFSAKNSPIDGSQLDYSHHSLLLVDQVLRDFYLEEAALPEDLHFIASCYVFETLRKNLGGDYLRSDAPNEFILLLGKPDAEIVCFVMERVWACAQAWENNTLASYFDAIKEQIAKKENAQMGAIPL